MSDAKIIKGGDGGDVIIKGGDGGQGYDGGPVIITGDGGPVIITGGAGGNVMDQGTAQDQADPFVLVSVVRDTFAFRTPKTLDAFLARHPEVTVDRTRHKRRRYVHLEEFTRAYVQDTNAKQDAKTRRAILKRLNRLELDEKLKAMAAALIPG